MFSCISALLELAQGLCSGVADPLPKRRFQRPQRLVELLSSIKFEEKPSFLWLKWTPEFLLLCVGQEVKGKG